MIVGIGDVDRPEALAEFVDEGLEAVTVVERMRGDVDEADGFGVESAQDPPCLVAVFDEVVGVRIEVQPQPFLLNDRKQLVHRPVERFLGILERFRPAAELGVDGVHTEVDGDLDDAAEVLHSGHALALVGPGDPLHRQQGRHSDARGVDGLGESADEVAVHLRVAEVGGEIRVRCQLQVFEPEVRRGGWEVEQSVRVMQRGGIVGDLHRCSR